MSNIVYLIAAYAVVVVGIGAYLLTIRHRRGALRDELDALEREAPSASRLETEHAVD